MAMNSGAMANQVIAALAAVTAKYKNIADDHRLSGYDLDSYNNDYWNAVCSAIVAHIQGNAKAVGTDSRGDSHNLDVT